MSTARRGSPVCQCAHDLLLVMAWPLSPPSLLVAKMRLPSPLDPTAHQLSGLWETRCSLAAPSPLAGIGVLPRTWFCLVSFGPPWASVSSSPILGSDNREKLSKIPICMNMLNLFQASISIVSGHFMFLGAFHCCTHCSTNRNQREVLSTDACPESPVSWAQGVWGWGLGSSLPFQQHNSLKETKAFVNSKSIY